LGIALSGVPGAGVALVPPEDPEPMPPEDPVPVLLGEPASDFGASPGIGEGVGAGVGAGLAIGALGAGGGGVVTFVSSFLLQAVRPTATRAAIRSERFIFFSFRKTSTV
jgi:hypothetical protein